MRHLSANRILRAIQTDPRNLRISRYVVFAIHVLFTYLLLTPDPYAKVTLLHSFHEIEPEGYFIHLGVYFGLALTLRAVTTSPRIALLGMVYISAHGMLSEYAQSFVPGRTCDPWDALANVMGIGIAIMCYRALMRTPQPSCSRGATTA